MPRTPKRLTVRKQHTPRKEQKSAANRSPRAQPAAQEPQPTRPTLPQAIAEHVLDILATAPPADSVGIAEAAQRAATQPMPIKRASKVSKANKDRLQRKAKREERVRIGRNARKAELRGGRPRTGQAGTVAGSVRNVADIVGVGKSTIARWTSAQAMDEARDAPAEESDQQVERKDARGGHNRRVSEPLEVMCFFYVQGRQEKKIATLSYNIANFIVFAESISPALRTRRTAGLAADKLPLPHPSVVSRLCTLFGISYQRTGKIKPGRMRETIPAELQLHLLNWNHFRPPQCWTEDETLVQMWLALDYTMAIAGSGGAQVLGADRGPAASCVVLINGER